MRKNSIWFLGGLSGGHIHPLVSILKKEYSENKNNYQYYFFIPKNKLIESIILNQIGIEYECVIWKYSKPSKLSIFIFLFDTIIIFVKVCYYYFLTKPLKIYSTGGYFSLPFALFAWLFSIPFYIYHLDVIPGLAGKTIGYLNSYQCVVHEKTKQYICKKNINMIDYPIRYMPCDKKNQYECKLLLEKSDYYIIFILGGSQGSEEINYYITVVLSILKEKNVYIIHQTGEKQKNNMLKKYKKNNIEAFVFDYSDALLEYYNAADLIISRAGAGTLSEINFFEKCALIIPLQGLASNHQVENARIYAEKNKLIQIISDKDSFIKAIKKFLLSNK